MDRDRSFAPSARGDAVRGSHPAAAVLQAEHSGPAVPDGAHPSGQGHTGPRPDVPVERSPRRHPVSTRGTRSGEDRHRRSRRGPPPYSRHIGTNGTHPDHRLRRETMDNHMQATLQPGVGLAAYRTTATPDMPDHARGTSPQVYARIAGVIWVIVAVLAPFAEFFVRQRLIVPGNVAATAENIVASQSLFRAGFRSEERRVGKECR